MRRIIIFILIVTFTARANFTYAIPPPDFIFNVGSQFLQIFSLLSVLLAAFFGIFLNYSKIYLSWIRRHLAKTSLIIVVILTLTALGAFFLDQSNKKNQERIFTESVEKSLGDQIEQYDKLTGSAIQELNVPNLIEDINTVFINRYYTNIAAGNLASAYAVSKQNVSFETFKSWYQDVTDVELGEINQIDDNKYAFTLQLFEGDLLTHYVTVMTISNNDSEKRIIDSTARVLSTENILKPNIENINNEINLFAENPQLTPFISNEEFDQINNNEIFILDAREDEEYDLGHYPGSTHIRFADLLAGRWVELPTDRIIYIICWSGIRGETVSTFLREKGIASQYLEDGAVSWVKYGGDWIGGILFSTKYSEERYTKTIATKAVHDYVNDGVILIDSRDKEKNNKPRIPNSIQISTIFTPSINFPGLFAQVPAQSRIITICDDFLSCFDAKLTGIKLEKQGHTFLGRYAAPYEF